MNPDKLFDYLEGRLPAAERAALEAAIDLRQAAATRASGGATGFTRVCAAILAKFCCHPRSDVTEQGRKMALRVGTAFIILMAVNVGIGLWIIARHETKNPNRALLETQMRKQITNSLEHAAATSPLRR